MKRKEKSKVNKTNKILSLLPGILYNMLVIFSVVLIAIIVMQRLSDSNKSIGGYKIFKVVSGSMEPKYDVGEVVICKETEMDNIKIGDAIVYRGKIGDLNGRIVMHEVVQIHNDENNNLTFFAKGLNNSKGDPEIGESQVLGVVKFRSGILTLLYKLATSIYSAFIIITLLVINVFVSFKSGEVEEDAKNSRKDKKSQNTKKVQNSTNFVEEPKKQEEIKSENKKIEETNVKNDEKIAESQNPVKEEMKKNTTSKMEKEENSVIDSKEEFDKIENVEKTAKSTSSNAKKGVPTTKKTTTKKSTTPKKSAAEKNSTATEKEKTATSKRTTTTKKKVPTAQNAEPTKKKASATTAAKTTKSKAKKE